MAIALTTQPTNNGQYSAYFQLKFVATETTNNPEYLLFTLKTSAGASISGVPSYKAPNINNTYTFDASAYLKSLFDVRQLPTAVVNTIQDVTDLYGKYEVLVEDPINALTSLTSNEFYVFPFIDSVRSASDQTATNGCVTKRLLYAGKIKDVGASGTEINPLPSHIRGTYDCVYLWRAASITNNLYIDTYEGYTPNNNSTIKQTLTVDLSSYSDQLLRIPLNNTFFNTLGTVLKFESFKIRYRSSVGTFYYGNQYCSYKEFLYVNRYGMIQNIVFKTLDNQEFATTGQTFTKAGFDLVPNAGNFNFGGDVEKINQDNKQTIIVEAQHFSKLHKDVLEDFVSSPVHAVIIDGYPIKCNVLDGNYKLVEDSKGIEFNFRAVVSQKRPSFI